MNYTVKTTIPVSTGATVTVSGDSPVFILPEGVGNIEVLIDVTAMTGGTSPSITPTLQVSPDGTNWYNAATGSAMTAAGLQRLVAQSLCGYARVAYNVVSTPTVTITVLALAN